MSSDGKPALSDREYVKLLGRGGQGEVWLVRNRTVDRLEALKILLRVPDKKSPDFVRFEREIRILAKLNHPNIVTMYDARPRECCYLMEYLEGGSLEERLRKGMGWEEGAGVLISVGEALAYAHREKLTHRDLKPQNVLFTSEGVPKVTDFGLAKMEGQRSATQTNQALGTPRHMPPEQFQDAKRTDARADVWALGTILYRMLAGHDLFPELETGYNIAVAVSSKEIPRPSEERELDGLGRALESVCMRALEKDLARRYPSMAEMVADLKRAVRRPGMEDTVVDRKRAGNARKWGWIALAAAFLLASVFGFLRFRSDGLRQAPGAGAPGGVAEGKGAGAPGGVPEEKADATGGVPERKDDEIRVPVSSARFLAEDGVIRDRLTSLEWRVGPDRGDWSYLDAKEWVESLGDGWRLPTIEELRGIYLSGDQRQHNLNPAFEMKGWWAWSSEIEDSKARGFYFGDGSEAWESPGYRRETARAFATRGPR